MKRNQPSPAEAQTPSPAEAQNPEQNHTQPSQDPLGAVASQATPSPQDTPPPAAETQNVSPSSEEEATHGISPVPIAAKLEEIYDVRPVQQTATVEEVKAAPKNAYDVPPAPRAAQPKEVYDASPVQQTATVEEVKATPESVYDVPPSPSRPVAPEEVYVLPESVYDIPPSPRSASLSDTYDVLPPPKVSPYAVYDIPSTPPPHVPPRTTATYDVPSSHGTSSVHDNPSKAHTWPRSKDRKQHAIYDIPSQPGEAHPRADEQGNIRGVTRSSSFPTAEGQTGQDTQIPEPIYAEIPDLSVSGNVKSEPIYETIPDSPESVSREPALTPEQVRSLYATVLPKSARPQMPPHPKPTEQTTADKQRGLAQEDVPPPLPPHPDFTEQHIAQDGTQKPEQAVHPKVTPPPVSPRPGRAEQRTAPQDDTRKPEQVVRPKVTPPPVSPRPGRAEQRTASELSADTEYTTDINPKVSRPKVSRPKAAPPPVPPRPEYTKQDPTTKKPEAPPKQVVRPKAFRPPLPPRPEYTKQKPKGDRGSEVSYTDISRSESFPARGSTSSNVSFSSGPGDDGPDREYGHVYATVLSKEQKEARNKNQNASSRSREESTSSESSGGLPQGSRRKRSSLNKSQANIVCAAYRQEIAHWSKVVYGKDNLFNKAMEDIQKNPNCAEGITTQISHSPKSFHKLAGISVCGLKNKPRKEAEAGLYFLVQAITGYANAERYLKNIESTSVNLEREMKPLTQKEIVGKVQRNPAVQYMATEVRFWCQKVFGDASLMDYHMEDAQKVPDMAEQTAWQVTTDHRIFGKLAGRQFCGIQTSARKEAIEALPHLAKAMTDYGESVQEARENIIKSHEEKVERYRDFVEKSQKLAQQKEDPGISKQQADQAVSFPFRQKSTQATRTMSAGM